MPIPTGSQILYGRYIARDREAVHSVFTLDLLVALIILGIADSFGIPLLTNYYTDIKAVEHYGYDRALSVYSLFENGAQSLGSFVFGIVLTVGVAKGLRTMIMVMGVLAVCFLVSVLFCMRKEKKTGGA